MEEYLAQPDPLGKNQLVGRSLEPFCGSTVVRLVAVNDSPSIHQSRRRPIGRTCRLSASVALRRSLDASFRTADLDDRLVRHGRRPQSLQLVLSFLPLFRISLG